MVQIDSHKADLDAHLADTSAAHAASAVSFSPTGTVAATNVQAAIAEVASEAGGGSGLPAATERGTVTRYDSTAWRARGPYELWLEDFGTGGNITYATDNTGATGENCAPIINAAVAKAIALNPNRGGVTLRADRQKYNITTSPAVVQDFSGFELRGTGNIGTNKDQSLGCTQFIIGNGVSFLRLNSVSGHGTRGPVLANFHAFAADGATTGNGILITDHDIFFIEHVSCSDFIGGYGFRISGGTGGAQYGVMYRCISGSNLLGIHLADFSPSGCRITDCYLEGYNADRTFATATPTANTIGIWIERGGAKITSPVISGYETGIYFQNDSGESEVTMMRGEYNNTHIRIGAASTGTSVIGGDFDDNLLPNGVGAVSVGIRVDFGATNVLLMPAQFLLSKAGAQEVTGLLPQNNQRYIRPGIDQEIVRRKTTNYTITAADNTVLMDASDGVHTATLPSASAVPGAAYRIKRLNGGANAVTVATTAGLAGALATPVRRSENHIDAAAQTSVVATVQSPGIAQRSLIVVVLHYGQGTTPTIGVTGSAGNIYTLAKAQHMTTGQTPHVEVWSAIATNGLAPGDTITALCSAGTMNFPEIQVYEIPNVDIVTRVTGTPAGASGTSTAPSSGNVVTAVADAVLFAAITYGNLSAFTPGASYATLFADGQGPGVKTYVAESRIVAATGTYGAAGVIGTSTDWVAVLVAFAKAASFPQTIDGASTVTLASQYALVEVVSDGSNWQIVSQI